MSLCCLGSRCYIKQFHTLCRCLITRSESQWWESSEWSQQQCFLLLSCAWRKIVWEEGRRRSAPDRWMRQCVFSSKWNQTGVFSFRRGTCVYYCLYSSNQKLEANFNWRRAEHRWRRAPHTGRKLRKMDENSAHDNTVQKD